MKQAPDLFVLSHLLLSAWCLTVSTGCSGKAPRVIAPALVSEIPHDSAAFVQGLFYDNGKLYESDGLYGQSALRVLDAQNGVCVKRVSLDKQFFGEGCAKMGTLAVQITWQEQTGLTWSLADLSPGPTIVYSGEGWGLTSDGGNFYMSNGSDTIFVRNKNFTMVRKIPVALQGRPMRKLNELEYVNNTLFANVWYSDSILEINPKNGNVEAIIDCNGLVQQEKPNSSECVLNGIAYNPETKTFYLTGKKWKNIFIVKIASVK
jgi:glutamine cyclotransferase